MWTHAALKKRNTKSPLSHQQKILMGKDAIASLKPVQGPAYKGELGNNPPFDREQSKKNKALGYW